MLKSFQTYRTVASQPELLCPLYPDPSNADPSPHLLPLLHSSIITLVWTIAEVMCHHS
jgi:hypothetical protein